MHQFSTAPPATALPGATAGSYPGPSGNEDVVGSFFDVILRRKWLISALFVSTVLAVGFLTALVPKTYTTHVKFIAGASAGTASAGPNPQTAFPILNALIIASGNQSSQTYAEMMRETPAAARVIAELHLPITPSELLSHVAIRPITDTSILDVAVKWSDPASSAQVANTLAAEFVQERRELVGSQADSAIAELTRQLPQAEERMHVAGERLSTFQAVNGIADVTAQTQNTLGTASRLDARIAQGQVDQQQANASLRTINSELSRTPANIAGGFSSQPNPLVAQLRTQLAQIGVQLKTAQQQYTAEHPTVKSLLAQEAQIKKELAKQPETIIGSQSTMSNPLRQQLTQEAARLNSQIAADHAGPDVLRRQRAAMDPAIRALPAKTQRLLDLQRQAKLTETVYDAVRQKLTDATLAKTTALSDVTVLERASAITAAVSPNMSLNLVVGAILGFVLSLVGAVFVDFRDGSVRSEEDVEERLALPLLATVPALGPSSSSRAQWVRTAMIESILHLVTSLRYASSGDPKTIAFTSAGQGEGKSRIALDTAIAYAELRPRVLLVDADLRIPTLHQKLGLENRRGLTDALVGTATIDEVVTATQHPGLDVVTSGTPTPNPMRLLQSEAFDNFLKVARERYEVIIIDTTACGSISDAAPVCLRVDGTVFVIARGGSDIRGVRRAIARLQSLGVRNILGAVLNKVVPRKSEIGAYGELGEGGARTLPLPPGRSA